MQQLDRHAYVSISVCARVLVQSLPLIEFLAYYKLSFNLIPSLFPFLPPSLPHSLPRYLRAPMRIFCLQKFFQILALYRQRGEGGRAQDASTRGILCNIRGTRIPFTRTRVRCCQRRG